MKDMVEKKMSEVIVVIPVYQADLAFSEQSALRQVFRILAKYPICFVAPEKMRPFFDAHQEYLVEYFPDNSFANRLAYSKLLLTPDFYRRFELYKYMLIYQLDAWVFSDRLEEFCAMDYDYIGAPMQIEWGRIFHTTARVGNGGLSLRKIESFVRLCESRFGIYEKTGLQEIFEKAEDIFWGYCGWDRDIDFRVPKVKTAMEFSVINNVAHAWERVTQNHLPFGCHYWNRSPYFELWRPYIASDIGKNDMNKIECEIDPSTRNDYINGRIMKGIVSYLMQRKHNEEELSRIHTYLSRYIPSEKKLIVWGYGVVGKRCIECLKSVGYSIYCIFDCKITEEIFSEGDLITKPNEELMKKKEHFIVVATKKCFAEIADQLHALGLEAQKDFEDYKTVENAFVYTYYGEFWSRYLK